MTTAYERESSERWHAPSDVAVGVVCVFTVAAVWLGPRCWVLTAVPIVLVFVRRAQLGLTIALFITIGGYSAQRAWSDAQPRHLGPFSGWVLVVADPQPMGHGVRLVVEIDHERFEVAAFGRAGRRLGQRQAGEMVEVIGTRVRGDGIWARRALVRHVVGGFEVDQVGSHAAGSPLASANNRIRDRLQRSAEATMSIEHAALFTGLVIGDDSRQSKPMTQAFRASGLSHLTAVSGQNVVFVLALAGVVLRRLSALWRLAATLAVIAWFVLLTRVEPSVLRAGTMAAWSAAGYALGSDRPPARMLALAVTALVVVDPLLVWSVGFWLSSGATFGVTVVAPLLARRLSGPRWLVQPIAITFGAQAGVLVPSWLVFGRMPVLGLFSNLLAVPVAGFVMLYGIPAGLAFGVLPGVLGSLVMLPATVGTRWVAEVAAVAAAAEPQGVVALLALLAQAIGFAWWVRRSRRI